MVFLFIFTPLLYRFDVKTIFFYNQPVKVKNNIIIVTTTCDAYRGPSEESQFVNVLRGTKCIVRHFCVIASSGTYTYYYFDFSSKRKRAFSCG